MQRPFFITTAMLERPDFIKYEPIEYSDDQIIERSRNYYSYMDKRRSIREFSSKPVPREVIENILKTASSSPSGAHKQPWTFCVVSDPEVKKIIRDSAEKEEYQNYHGRMSEEWLEDLKKFDTDWNKPFLEEAPYLIIIFKKVYGDDFSTHYYVNESVGIAAGILISAIHNAGLITLTHTPSPMNFLNKILNRPNNERPFLVMPVGHPKEEAKVPDLRRKDLPEISQWY